MNTRHIQRNGQTGSVLMVALVTALVLGIALASYLLLMQHQGRMVNRGQAWNHALALAEAGVEDALAQLNRSFGTNNSRGGINGWSGSASGPASLAAPRALSGGTYAVTISAGLPIITSTGRVAVVNSSKFIERQVRVLTTTEAAFRVAMASQKNITFNGNNVLVDSYDSADPNHSTPTGLYNPATAKAGGDVASTEGFISVGNADVKGKLYTGPVNAGQYSVGPNGSVGGLTWNGPGIQPGWYFNDFNLEFTDVAAPYQSGVLPAGKGTNLWELGSFAYYYSGDFSAASSKTIYVAGKATVYVTGGFDMKGTIIIAPGASLKLYVGGASTGLNQVNTDGNAATFQYYGLPTNTDIKWGGNNAYVGTVYAPQASFTCGGGGNNTYDYQGACVVSSVNLNGHFNFHFDENLRRRGPVSAYVLSSWEEL